MGHRELKRVPLDFNWPIGEGWRGYLNPHPHADECPACKGQSYNPETAKIADDFYDSAGNGTRWCSNITQDEVEALVAKGRLMDFTRVPINDEQAEVVKKKIADGGNSWLPYDNGRMPTAAEVNEWNEKGMGHDAINRWILIEARATRLGVFGLCENCEGEGIVWANDEAKATYESWEEYEPPEGEGYQLWETTSEGSPSSPVFQSAEELARWCVDGATIFGSNKAPYETWLKMFQEDSIEDGSLLVATKGYFGPVATMPEEEPSNE